jgi:hypothetical protein
MLSASRKVAMFASTVEQLKRSGTNRLKASMLLAHCAAVPLKEEWLEAFWCGRCLEKRWYHVRKIGEQYSLRAVTPADWQHATGVQPLFNPTVSEFSRREARKLKSRQH